MLYRLTLPEADTMSRTLSLVETAWDVIQLLVARKQYRTALRQLMRLLARPDVPETLIADAHRLAGRLALELEQYPVARRYWKAVVERAGDSAEAYYAIGRAWEEDPEGCDRRAMRAFRRALKHEPANPIYRAAYGRSAARCGHVRHGTRHMLAAAQQAENDLAVIRVIVPGLLEIGQAGQARRIVAKARFLTPGNAELAALWAWVKFEEARSAQRSCRGFQRPDGVARMAKDARFAMDGVRTIVPLLQVVGTTPPRPDNGWRRDAVSCPRPHIAYLSFRKADR
jgi:tetratricopeptide (TPR) repeat protein